ncbi:hypothetical protein Y032_0129g1509 [Ancylostoma ceylanicum]|uniref:Uncharacterized protein n=1 Tax=Ancylostoma ceylanicum TaxID=53326 RepID=A0A016T7T3_9BILA|nr:hypothetical protein Y032_0129g1509 [Ancylostoma ceylanicum]
MSQKSRTIESARTRAQLLEHPGALGDLLGSSTDRVPLIFDTNQRHSITRSSNVSTLPREQRTEMSRTSAAKIGGGGLRTQTLRTLRDTSACERHTHTHTALTLIAVVKTRSSDCRFAYASCTSSAATEAVCRATSATHLRAVTTDYRWCA